jgi:hypothetical protein
VYADHPVLRFLRLASGARCLACGPATGSVHDARSLVKQQRFAVRSALAYCERHACRLDREPVISMKVVPFGAAFPATKTKIPSSVCRRAWAIGL